MDEGPLWDSKASSLLVRVANLASVATLFPIECKPLELDASIDFLGSLVDSHNIVFSAKSSKNSHPWSSSFSMNLPWHIDSNKAVVWLCKASYTILQSLYFSIPWWGHCDKRILKRSKNFQKDSFSLWWNWFISFVIRVVLWFGKYFLRNITTNHFKWK